MQYNPKKPDPPKGPRDGVPQELIDKLHEANEKFSDARHHLEEAFDSEECDNLARREQAIAELTEAENKLDETNEQVKPELKRTD